MSEIAFKTVVSLTIVIFLAVPVVRMYRAHQERPLCEAKGGVYLVQESVCIRADAVLPLT